MRRAGCRIIITVAAASISVAGIGSTAAAGTTPSTTGPATKTFQCDRGTICLWDRPHYRGGLTTYDLRNITPGDCVELKHLVPRSLVNRSDRPLSVYADEHCGKEQQHATYPAGGTFVPEMAFAVTAIELGK